VTALRREEQAAMARLGADGRCLMRALQEELDDPDPQDCGRCSVCAGPRFAGPLDADAVRAAALHLRGRPLPLDAKKMAPDAEGRMRKIPDDARVQEGRALARAGDGGWDPLVRAGRAGGAFATELADAAAELVRAWAVPVAWVTAVPSRSADVPGLARALAERLGLPFAPVVTRAEDRPPQREMANAVTQAANVRGAFAVAPGLPPGPVLLVDDLRLSGWTLAMVGGQLRRRGAPAVWPLALSTAV
jgi:ATP-dependent DNA helicase RecQ